MLKYSEIQNAFKDNNIDIVEYNVETNEILELPFVVYVAEDGDMFNADGVNYVNFLNVGVVMIDETMNFDLQRKIEEVFYTNEITFEKNITFAEDERLYTVTYMIQVYDI